MWTLVPDSGKEGCLCHCMMTVINQVCTPFCTLMLCFPTYYNVQLLCPVFTPCDRLFHDLSHVSYHRTHHHQLQAFLHILINFQRHKVITYFNQTHILYVSTTFHSLYSQESTIKIYSYESTYPICQRINHCSSNIL